MEHKAKARTMIRSPLVKSVAAAALSLPMAAMAHNYTYLEGGFLDRDYGNEDDSGFRIAGSGSITDNVALFGEYSDVGRLEQITAGALYHMPLNKVIDLNLGASFEHVEAGPVDDSGFGLRAGLRWQLTPYIEMNPEIRYVDVFNDSATSLRLAGLFAVTKELDIQAALQGGDDDRIEVGVRYNFGPRG
jgi:opacity protein-like surface antigen